MEAACDIFYNAYGNSRRSSVINGLLERLEFHALSTTLLATTASHNGWDHAQLAEEWDTQRARVLQKDHNKSLVATIELSLTSPTFCSLGPDARDLLGVVAFFPQGIDENNLDWLFPTISNRRDVFDKSCVLSLTHRSNGFVTMTAPIRDYLSPQDPQSSPLLCTTKDRYFSRLSVEVDPNKPGFQEAQWVASEDVNIEHLLDVFTSLNQDATHNWDACYHFMDHLYWHKPRETVLGPKIEALPDDHQSKPRCLFGLSRLFRQAWNHTEQKRLLIHTLELERRRGDDSRVAETLRLLSDANRLSYFLEEGIQQAKEAVDILQRIDDPVGQAVCLNTLAWLLFDHHQLNAAEDAASRAIDLISGKSQEYHLCELHRVLGRIFQTKGEKGKAIHHFEAVLRIATPFDWHQLLFWTHSSLAKLFCDEREFDDASAHIGQAKSHAVDGGYNLGRSHKIQANIWYHQGRLKDAKSEVLHAFGIFEELGATKDIGDCRNLLYNFELESKASSPGAQGELLETISRPASVNSRSSTTVNAMVTVFGGYPIPKGDPFPSFFFQGHFPLPCGLSICSMISWLLIPSVHRFFRLE